MATIVIPVAPVKAVNRALVSIATIARFPGIHPRKAFAIATTLSGVLVLERIYPANVNSGSATIAGVDTSLLNSVIMVMIPDGLKKWKQ